MINREDHSYKNGDYKRYFYVDEEKVFGFFEKYRFLSNFHKCATLYGGLVWPSSEHAYMVSKCDDIYYQGFEKHPRYDDTRYQDIYNMSCFQVKEWGRSVNLREDWEEIKLKMMYSICLDKFTRNKELKQKLLDTGNRELIEANSWGDSYWGFDVKVQKGENNLGKVLMGIRDRLK